MSLKSPSFLLSFFLLFFSISPLLSQTQIFQRGKVQFTCDTRFGKVTGSFSKINPIQFDSVKKIAKIQIDISSISTGNSMRDRHLKAEDFFHAEKFPHAFFEITSLQEDKGNLLKLSGKLTIKDITKDVDFPVEVQESNSIRTYKGSLQVNRRDFQLNYDSLINPIQDSVLIEITAIVEVKKP
jgi:polyisoprenoid-binding protein YceI